MICRYVLERLPSDVAQSVLLLPTQFWDKKDTLDLEDLVLICEVGFCAVAWYHTIVMALCNHSQSSASYHHKCVLIM